MDNFKTSGSLVVFLLILVQRCIFIFCASVDRGVQVLDLERRLKQHSHQSSKHTDDAGSGGKRSDEKGRGSANMSEQHRPQNGKEFSLKSTSYAYVTSLSIGKPPQKLYFLIDTGSANTALAGPRCADQFGEKCKIDSFYRPEKSRTSFNLHTPIEAEYGKGAWSGELYKDVISFPGGSPSTMAEFAVIDHQKDFFVKNSINEGILGLAFKALATDGIEPLFDQLVKNRKVPDVFTLALCNGMGKLWLGEPDSSSYVGSLQYTRLLGPTWYTITVVGLDVGGSRVDVASDSFPDAIVDSGTTDILLHLDAYIAVVAELKSRGPSVDTRFWNGFCVKTDPYKWPYLTIYLRNTKGGSFALTVLGKHYIRKQDEFYCLSIGAKQSGVVLGEVALEGNVVVFDRANKRLGFASSNITHPKSGPCGNPVTINTTVSGELSKFCDERYMPWESCHVHCQPCVHSGGAWCPSGHVVVWINGVKSRLNASHGFCWSGGAFSFQNEIIQTFLKGHGGVEFQIFCNSIFPMYKQCTVDSMTLFILIAAIPVVIATAFLYCISRRIIFFSKLPATILERGKPLVWFEELERRGELSPDNLSCLEDFFPYVSLNCLLKTLYDYQTKRRIIMFFQEGVQREIPTVYLDDIFNEPWTWKEQLPKNFLQKCQNLMSEACHSTSTVQGVSSLLSKAVTLLGKSCRPNANQDLKTTAAKILHVSNLFFQKYHAMILENKDMESWTFRINSSDMTDVGLSSINKLHKVSSISLVQPTVNHVNSTLPKAVKEKGTSLCRRILEQFLPLLAAVISIFMVLITESLLRK